VVQTAFLSKLQRVSPYGDELEKGNTLETSKKAPKERISDLAALAFTLTFIFPVAGLVTGIMANRQAASPRTYNYAQLSIILSAIFMIIQTWAISNYLNSLMQLLLAIKKHVSHMDQTWCGDGSWGGNLTPGGIDCNY
jgi:hypothetical protein